MAKKKEKKEKKAGKRMSKKELAALLIDFFHAKPSETLSMKYIFSELHLTTHPQKMLCADLLHDLSDDDYISEIEKGKFRLNNHGTEMIGTFQRKSNGKNSFIPEGGGDPIFVAERNSAHAMNNDKVKITFYAKRKNKDAEGEVIEILERANDTFVGTLEVAKSYAFLVTENRTLANDIFIPKEKLKGGKTGDMRTVNQLDKFEYLPRTDGGNGTILKGTVYYSMDKENWTEAGAIDWKRNGDVKVFTFTERPTARYIKLAVTEGVNNYGSGRELYVFKVPGTESRLQGDINNDGKIDNNDLTSYTNYTGLRKGDSDYEGYISVGDIDQNGLIDAYDISVVATQLEDGVSDEPIEKLDGTIEISTAKRNYSKGDVVEVLVKGVNLRSVNALSFALPYNQQDYEFVGVEPLNLKAMENLTYDRLHTNGTKALYPTFVNLGAKEALEGTNDLFILKLKAKRAVKFDLKAIDGVLVDKNLNTRKF